MVSIQSSPVATADEPRKVRVEQTIIIARPIEAVFAYRTALQRTSEWQRDVVASDYEIPDFARVGARGAESRHGANGITEEWGFEITELEPNSVLGIVSHCGAVQIHERSLFANVEGGDTRYTVSVEMAGSPLPASAVQKRTVELLMNFKARLEA